MTREFYPPNADYPIWIDIRRKIVHQGISPCIITTVNSSQNDFIMEKYPRIIAMRGRKSPSDENYTMMCEERTDGVSNTITTVNKDNLLVEPIQKYVLEQAKQLAKGKRNETATAVLEDNGNIRSCYFDEKGKNNSISEGVFTYDRNPSAAVTTQGHSACYGESTDFRIRKLTPLEVGRLMDVDDADIRKIQAAGISETQQFKMFGNSIVVNCLYHIFRKMFIETENENQQLTLF